jgi:putative transposase
MGTKKRRHIAVTQKMPFDVDRKSTQLLLLSKVCYLLRMTEMYKIQPKGLYFVTLTVVGGIDVFTRFEYCDLLVENLNYCIDNKRLRVYEYAIMPSQLYMIADVEQGKSNLPKVLRDLKSYSAKQLLRAISEHPDESRKEWLMRLFHFFANRYQHDSEHHFWQFGNQPVDLEKLVKKDKPIPTPIDKLIKAKWVDDPVHYIYCSAYPLQRVKLSTVDRLIGEVSIQKK